MKKYILLLLIGTFILGLGACSVGRTTESRGLENQAYLQFVRGTEGNYSEGVEVYVDGAEPFVAKVNKVNSRTVKGDVYVINSGTRYLKVMYKGAVLYEKTVVLSTQETRRIQLP